MKIIFHLFFAKYYSKYAYEDSLVKNNHNTLYNHDNDKWSGNEGIDNEKDLYDVVVFMLGNTLTGLWIR